MDFKEHTLGIKLQNNFVAIEECNDFGDLSKYDFIYTDFVSRDWNGNTSYGSKIRNIQNGQEYYIINGWKLLCFSFPGNWSGNFTHIELEDRYGEKTEFRTSLNQASYFLNFKHLIREGLLEAMKFTDENPCVGFNEIINGFKSVFEYLNVNNFQEKVQSLEPYITKYRELSDKLITEEISALDDKLKTIISAKISEILDLPIHIDYK